MSHTELDVLRRMAHDAFGDPAAKVQVLPNALPQDWPMAISHLDAFTLLGSLETSAPHQISASVFLDSILPLEDSERLLGEALSAGGWTPAPHVLPRPTGFLTQADAERDPPTLSGPPHQWVHHPAQSVATLQGQEGSEGTHLTLRLEQGLTYTHHARQAQQPFSSLPVLVVPSGITPHALERNAGMNDLAEHPSTAALLRGEGTTSGLQLHFEGELRRQGWASGETGGDEALAVGTWKRPAEAGVWLGTLTLTQLGPAEWQVQFSALQRRTGPGGNSGWSSYSF